MSSLQRLNRTVGKAVANHAEVRGSIPSMDVGKEPTMKYSLPCLMLLYTHFLHFYEWQPLFKQFELVFFSVYRWTPTNRGKFKS